MACALCQDGHDHDVYRSTDSSGHCFDRYGNQIGHEADGLYFHRDDPQPIAWTDNNGNVHVGGGMFNSGMIVGSVDEDGNYYGNHPLNYFMD